MITAKVVSNVPEYKGVAFRSMQGYVEIDSLPQDFRTRVIQAALEYEIYAEEAWHIIRAGLKPVQEERIMVSCNKMHSPGAVDFLIRNAQESNLEESESLLRPLVALWHIRLVRAVVFRKWQLTSWVKRVFGARRGRNKANEGCGKDVHR